MSSTSEPGKTPFPSKPSSEAAQVSGHTQTPVDAAWRAKENRRRDKPQLSCHTCRRRKLRCDRRQPCSTCSTRGLPCAYGESQGFKTTAATTTPSIHDRLVHLERLVLSLMPPSGGDYAHIAGDLSPPGSASASASVSANHVKPAVEALDVPSECGSMRASDSDLRYVGGDHWAAILDSITDLRDHLDRDEQFRLVGDGSDTAQNEASVGESANGLPRWRSPHAMLLYGASRPTSRADVLAALPPKVVVDRYVARYFNSLELASCIVHGPTFLKEYEAFWAYPSSVPIMWIGLLFSIIGLAVVTSDTTDNSTNSISSSDIEQQALRLDLYREKIVQCLISGEYTNAGPHALETVLHYLHIEFAARADADRDAWLLLALAVNLALRAGYHRDPDHFPGMRMSALQREMRRRVWATVLQADVLISTQMGMPRMVADSRWDAAEPKNYNDADLEPDAMELPPPRPETEFTTSLGIIARRRILLAVGAISDLMSATASCSYADVMNADSLLHDAAASIPPPLKPKSLAASITDSPQLITGRLFISHVFHKGQIMLHRRFLHAQSPASERDAFAYSRKACLDASLETLQIQHILDEETRPGGQLHSMRWRLSSIMNNQFLTATMILCSLLHRGRAMQRTDDIVPALHRARATWTRGSARSREAKRAAETVNFVLARAVGSGNGLDAGKGVDTGTLVDGTDQSTMSTLFEDLGEYDTGPWFDRQDVDLMLQEDFGLFQPNDFIMPTLLKAPSNPDQTNKATPVPISSLDSALGSADEVSTHRLESAL